MIKTRADEEEEFSILDTFNWIIENDYVLKRNVHTREECRMALKMPARYVTFKVFSLIYY